MPCWRKTLVVFFHFVGLFYFTLFSFSTDFNFLLINSLFSFDWSCHLFLPHQHQWTPPLYYQLQSVKTLIMDLDQGDMRKYKSFISFLRKSKVKQHPKFVILFCFQDVVQIVKFKIPKKYIKEKLIYFSWFNHDLDSLVLQPWSNIKAIFVYDKFDL